jgi:quercetin dioxygenase-like cupin family protein
MSKTFLAMISIASGALLFSAQSYAADNLIPSLVQGGKAVFMPVDPSQPNGIQISVVSGDPNNGPVAYLLKLPKGVVPNHWHTGKYYAVVVEGEHRHWLAKEKSKGSINPPGTTWVQPAGEAHAEGDECVSAFCTIFAYSPNGIGFRMAN